MISVTHSIAAGLLCRWWLKSAISLTTIMGLTWIVGVLVFHNSLVTLAYIFTIFVAFQVTAMLYHTIRPITNKGHGHFVPKRLFLL